MKIDSYEELDDALLLIANYEADLHKSEADLNKELQEVKERYDNLTAKTQGEWAKLNDAIETFCKNNKSDFEGDKRSRALTHGRVGFRNNPPKCVQLNKKWKVESSIAFIKELFKGKYIRTKPEINKEAILADYAKEKLTDTDLAGVGLRIDQEETFFCDVDWQSINQKSNVA